jgi:tetratricopeptide (TPR) repeat protein
MKKKKYLNEIKKGNYALALTLIDKEISENKDSQEDPEILYNFAICCSRTGNHKKAISVLKDLSTKFDRFIERDNIFRMIIFSNIQLGNLEEALKLVDERLKINIGDLKLLSFRAHILEKQKKLEDAITIHRNILKLEPLYKNSLNSLSYLLCTKQKPSDEEILEATAILKDLLKLEPENVAYLDSFGVLLKKRGMKKEAIRAFNKALSFENKYNDIILEHIQDLI